MKSAHLWITDPWNTLDHPRDTTLRLMQESLLLGIPCFWADASTLSIQNGDVTLRVSGVKSIRPKRQMDDVRFAVPKVQSLGRFRWVHYRCDPPVDQRFLHHVQILAWATHAFPQTKCINPPETLLLINEKFGGQAWAPPSLVSAHWETLKRFGMSQKVTVLKPLSLAQSKGVSRIHWKGSTAEELEGIRSRLAEATQEFRIPVLLQGFSPSIASGEDRIWFVDGQVLGHVRKFPLAGDFRVMIDHGSEVSAAPLSTKQWKVIQKIGAFLQQSNIRLAAVDLIGTHVIDFNVTSPGLLVQMEHALDQNLARGLLLKLIGKNKTIKV